MTSRLRRMLLVNIRSSGTMTSGAINEIDPRGGAAVTGDNGAGKTTTLKLLPIFFGTPPSQIEQPGGNREPMLRFALPDPACAIVFEYQRGDLEDDVRCVVVRRPDGSDAAEYRFIEGPFRREYFVGTVGDDGPEVFLDDGAMHDAADRLGVTPDRKLNAAQYRAVILNLKTNTHDAVMLRRLAARHSFSLRGLAHLDRLITAVVKERIDFRDFTQVAVAMAQSPSALTSSVAGQGGPGERLSLRQGREQIERWLRNRDSCASALALAPMVIEVRKALAQVVREEELLRERRADVLALIDARNQDLTQATKELEAAKTEDVRLTEDETARQKELDDSTGAARRTHEEASVRYESAKAANDRFDQQQARHWAEKVVALPSLHDEARQLQQQIGVAAGTAGGIEARYASVVTSIETQAAAAMRQREGEKRVLERGLSARLDGFVADERGDVEALDKLAADTRATRNDVLLNLSTRVGELQAQKLNPQIDSAVEKEVLDAEDAFEDAQEKLATAATALGAASTSFQQATSSYGRAELGVVAAREAVGKAGTELAAAKRLLAPDDGSLLAALRGCDSDDWRLTLAKVLDPLLLHSTSLKPMLADDEASRSHAFGWSLDLGGVPVPDWTDDAELRKRVQLCEGWAQRAAESEQSAINTRDAAGKARSTAESSHQAADAAHGVALRRFNECKSRKLSAKARRTASIEYARSKVTQSLGELNRQVDAHKRGDTEAAVLHGQAMQELQRIFKGRADVARQECDEACAQIDEAIVTHTRATAERIADIHGQRDAEISGQGVDVAKLEGLRTRLKAIGEEIGKLEAKMALVGQWQAWMSADGPTQMALAGAAEVVERGKANTARRVAGEHYDATQKLRKARAKAIDSTNSSIGNLEGEVKQLKFLDERFKGYLPRLGSGVDPQMTADEIKERIEGHESEVRRLDQRISSLGRDLKFKMTTVDGLVQQRVEKSLAPLVEEAASERRVAHELCLVHDQIGREIVTQVNTELSLVLENVNQFRKQVENFESEIERFNNRLRKGLEQVRFERLRDFKLNVVTDFSRLGFMDKIKLLDETFRDQRHRMELAGGYSTELPPESASQGLRQLSMLLGKGALEVDLAEHVDLSGSIVENGISRPFARDSELQHISSTGLSALILITLLSGMVNVIRGDAPVYLPWVTDEVGKFDPSNFAQLLAMLRDNKIDVVTASPKLTPAEYRQFAHRYRFSERGSIAVYGVPKAESARMEGAAA